MAIPVHPDDTLSRYPSAWISLHCKGCGHRQDVPATELAQRIGWKTRIDTVRPRFKCERCGTRKPVVKVGWDRKPPGWRSPR
jgi:hypothetical protein